MCAAEGVCGESLSCLPQENVCIPTGCAPASAFCTCDDGSCDGTLACQGGICIPPGAQGDADGSGDDRSDDSDDDGSTSTGPDGTGSTTDGVSGTSMGTSDTGDTGESGDTSDDDGSEDSDDTGPGMICADEPGCSECFSCASQPSQSCEPQTDACQAIGGCPVVAQCLQGCSAEGLCLDDCCAGASGAAVSGAHALDSCRRDTCATTCGDFNDAPCSSS